MILIDLRVGFERTLYSVPESAGELMIPVRVLADENGITPEVGLPLGVRVTSRDGSAVGTALLYSTCTYIYIYIYTCVLTWFKQDGAHNSRRHAEEEDITHFHIKWAIL